MSRLLSAITRATRRRIEADRAYRESIRAAREAGHSMPEIGEAAGITKQGVAWLLRPKGENDDRS